MPPQLQREPLSLPLRVCWRAWRAGGRTRCSVPRRVARHLFAGGGCAIFFSHSPQFVISVEYGWWYVSVSPSLSRAAGETVGGNPIPRRIRYKALARPSTLLLPSTLPAMRHAGFAGCGLLACCTSLRAPAAFIRGSGGSPGCATTVRAACPTHRYMQRGACSLRMPVRLYAHILPSLVTSYVTLAVYNHARPRDRDAAGMLA